MRKTIAVLALSLGILVVPSTAQADTPGCVTATEFYRISQGMPAWRVHSIFDTSGTLIDRFTRTAWVEDGYWEDYWVDESYYDPYWDEWIEDGYWDSEWIDTSFSYRATDTVRSYRKCRSFDRGRGRVGINFDDYNSTAGGLRVYRKVRGNPWQLVSYY